MKIYSRKHSDLLSGLHDMWADYMIWSSVLAYRPGLAGDPHYGGTLVYIHGVGVQSNYVSGHD